jgi:hypothetical protein
VVVSFVKTIKGTTKTEYHIKDNDWEVIKYPRPGLTHERYY